MTDRPNLQVVPVRDDAGGPHGFYSPEQVASLFGQFLAKDRVREEEDKEGNPVLDENGKPKTKLVASKGAPDVRWVHRHSAKRGFLHVAARKHKATRALLFDRAEVDRIIAEFEPPKT